MSAGRPVVLRGSNRTTVSGWKLLRCRRDGTLGPLFIDRKLVIPVGRWLRAKDLPTPGYQRRPGWHTMLQPLAPHLSLKGRIWCEVQVKGWVELNRPEAQGGRWRLAESMRVTHKSYTSIRHF